MRMVDLELMPRTTYCHRCHEAFDRPTVCRSCLDSIDVARYRYVMKETEQRTRSILSLPTNLSKEDIRLNGKKDRVYLKMLIHEYDPDQSDHPQAAELFAWLVVKLKDMQRRRTRVESLFKAWAVSSDED